MTLPIHAKTLWRLAAVAVAGLLFALLVPLPGVGVSQGSQLAVAVFAGGLGLVFFYQSTKRRVRLHETVVVELNRLRRVYHLSKNISQAGERYRPWFTEVHGRLYGYLSSFSGRRFSEYEKSNDGFRKLSYHVYAIPEISGAKEQALYADLLRTTAEVAQARQRIVELRDNRLSAYGWVVFLLSVAGFVYAVVMGADDTVPSRLVAGVAVAIALLVVDLLWETDVLAEEDVLLPQRYADNLSRLELRREE